MDLVSALKAGDSSASKRRPLVRRNVLVAVRVALSLALLTISVFSVQIYRRELTQGPGFRTTQIAKMSVEPGQAGYHGADAAQFFAKIVEEAERLPGVRAAAVTSAMPFFSFEGVGVVPEGYHLPDGQREIAIVSHTIDEHSFTTLGIPLLAGRAFGPTDTADQPLVAVVNNALAQHYWPGQSAIGRRFHRGGVNGPLVQIVGVASSTSTRRASRRSATSSSG